MNNFTLRVGVIGCLGLLAMPASFGADAVDVEAGASKAKPCLSCHDPANFAGKDAPELMAAIQSINAGEMAHLPLPATLTDDDLAAIAAYLASVANPDGED